MKLKERKIEAIKAYELNDFKPMFYLIRDLLGGIKHRKHGVIRFDYDDLELFFTRDNPDLEIDDILDRFCDLDSRITQFNFEQAQMRRYGGSGDWNRSAMDRREKAFFTVR